MDTAVLQWWTDLLALRRRLPELTDGRFDRVAVDVDEGAGRLVLRRGRVSVGVNLGPAATQVAVGPGRVVLRSDDRIGPAEAGGVLLPADSVVIVLNHGA